MKQSDVTVGATYLARVSGNLVSVRVVSFRASNVIQSYAPSADTYNCINVATGRKIVKTARQLQPLPVKITADEVRLTMRDALTGIDFVWDEKSAPSGTWIGVSCWLAAMPTLQALADTFRATVKRTDVRLGTRKSDASSVALYVWVAS